ncbi:aldo/keto reductase [uncultured Treponema sp.]|uniref:aldo/keto reductase n=1 Tax=uncultured Treponema sp. TaxID=162155 RepID=UPI0025D9E2E9|nr:aldo/keto reductase [uncultured Treponema sp.]
MQTIKLNNGIEFPVIGLGTFMLSPADAQNSTREALKMGYRLIDTANAYVNERAVGRGIKESGVARNEVFLSTKLWPSEYENPNAVDETLERLGVDYVDLLYIHQPAGNWLAGYRQLEKALKEGKARSIGISNFEGKYIQELETKWEAAPQFIQVEAHPYFTQKDLRVTLDKYGIKLMSWYPLGHGDKSLIQEPVFAELGKKYGKTPAQVILRWHVQMGFVVIPGSKNVDHIKDNLNIMDFELTGEEMAEIAKLDKGERYYHRTEEQLVQFAAWKPDFEKVGSRSR